MICISITVDCNARVGERVDYELVEHESLIGFGLQPDDHSEDEVLPWKSCDKYVHDNGIILLDMCKATALIILNSRKTMIF